MFQTKPNDWDMALTRAVNSAVTSRGQPGGHGRMESEAGECLEIVEGEGRAVFFMPEINTGCLMWKLRGRCHVYGTYREQTGYMTQLEDRIQGTTQWEDKRLDTNKWKGKTREVVQVDTETKQAGGQRETTTKIKCVLSVRQKSGTCGGGVGVRTCVS